MKTYESRPHWVELFCDLNEALAIMSQPVYDYPYPRIAHLLADVLGAPPERSSCIKVRVDSLLYQVYAFDIGGRKFPFAIQTKM
jgi:hypothetical protein